MYTKEKQDLEIKDNSGDKKYFTIIPNYIINHSTANDQALYLQMKRYAGENGECYVSETTLCNKLKIGRYSLKQSLKYLTDHKWIVFAGYVRVKTKGGHQSIKSYRIQDIWKDNINHYQGVSRLAHLGGVQISRGASISTQGVSRLATKKNNVKKNINSEFSKNENSRPLNENEYEEIMPDGTITVVQVETEEKPKINISKEMNRLIAWAVEKRGANFTSPGKQRTHIKNMLSAKYTIDQIKERWQEMEGEEYWQDKGFDFANVANSLDKRPVKEKFVRVVGKYKFKTLSDMNQAEKDGLIHWDWAEKKWVEN